MGTLHPGPGAQPGDDRLVEALIFGTAGQKSGRAVLEQEKEFFLGLVQNLTTAMFVLDRRHRVVIWNRECEKLTGVKAADVLGTDRHWSALHPEPRPCLADIVIDNSFKDIPRYYGSYRVAPLVPEGWQAEGWLRGLPGADRFIVVDAVPIRGPGGELIAAVETIRDITHEHATHEALLRKDQQLLKLQRMEAVGRLAGGIAHSFNNLLTSILGYGRLVREGLGMDHPLARDMDEILHAGDRAAKLTKQLLAFSREQTAQPEPMNINAVVIEMGRLLRGTLGEHIQLAVEVDRNLWNVMADPVLIEQVIMNIAVNAREAMPAGGRLTIRTSNLTCDGTGPRPVECECGRYVLVSIADSGRGMTAEVREHLFEPFFTTQDRSQRLGLGLSTAYGIVKQFKGCIEVRSQEGEGSEFRIYLPAASEPLAVMLETAEDVLPRGHETVIVVEDDDSVRRLLNRILQSLGYTVLQAASGDEALSLAAAFEKPIDLLITDVVMPGMGGERVAARLRAARPGIKVLFASGFTDGGLVSNGLLDSSDPIILKPYTRESISVKVRQVLDEPAV